MGLNEIANNLNIISGQASVSSKATNNARIIYPAIVRDVTDFSNHGRLKVEIISIDANTGEQQPGKDNNTPLSKLPLCIPLIADFLHSSPQIGEMVLVFLENPSDLTSTRYWVGPIRTTKFPKENESFESANAIFRTNTFSNKSNVNSTPKSGNLPNINDIYVKGKDDSDITFKSREVLIRAGTLVDKTTDLNTTTVCTIQMVQKDKNTNVTPFSQINIKASNINLISSDSSSRKNRTLNENGKLTDESNIENNTNKRLSDFGSEANELHPLVLGDELVKLLKVIIRFCLNHRHTPQETPYAPTEEIDILNDFLSDDTMKVILSNTVRTN